MDISKYKAAIISNINKVQNDPNIEMEAIYRTNIDYPLDRTTFNRVISYIKGYNQYSMYSSGSTLDIFLPDEDDSIRFTVYGDGAINSYCKSNTLSTLKPNSYMLQRKARTMKPIDINNYNIRINFKKESEDTDIKANYEIFNRWSTLNKLFRYKKRFSFITNDKLFSIDFTIVKSSNIKVVNNDNYTMKKRDINENMRRFIVKPKNIMGFDDWFETLKENDDVELRGKKHEKMVPYKSIQASNVLRNDMKYEIEIEYLGNKNNDIKAKYETILNEFVKHIEYILKAIQNNPFIISQEEKSEFKNQYNNIMKTRRFAGPQPTALEMKHVTRKNYSDYRDILSIRRNYCVTDKADGERNVLCVMNNGSAFMINRKHEIKSLGCKMPNMAGTVLDGEYIVKDKQNKPMIMFMMFDIYFYKNSDLRMKPFYRNDEERQLRPNDLSRYESLNDFYEKMVLDKSVEGIIVSKKTFYFGDIVKYNETVDTEIMKIEGQLNVLSENDPKYTHTNEYLNSLKSDTKIFKHSKTLLEKTYPYNIDGLIFTPINLAVGGSFDSQKKTKYDGRWYECFKWKPPLETTIDFLVFFKKNPENKTEDLIQYSKKGDKVIKYKTAVLYVGYMPKRHTEFNSCRVLNEELIFDEEYTNVPFQPYNPYIKNIEFAYIPFENENNVVYTADKQIISDGNIVEFRYNSDLGEGFWWESMRVRNINKPNDFITAINNWRTLHNPILKDMITSGETPNVSDVYYIKNKDRNKLPTKPLADFHSYIKKTLISKVSKGAKNYLDLCAGKCGDMNHWIDLKLSNIVCIELNRDNIENKDNGGCKRILNALKDKVVNKNTLKNTMMIWGDASLTLDNGDAGRDDLNKYYLNVLYGNVEQSLVENSKLQRLYGIFKDTRFDIVSCQFSIHYFFETQTKLGTFLTNVSKNLNKGGKFVGTALDGDTVFNKLQNESSIFKVKSKDILWKINKKYKKKTFVNDDTSIGYPIDVYINSIGKTTTEWLVNFDYLKTECDNYNLKLVEVKNFKDIYMDLTNSNKKYGDVEKMDDELMELSFMYNYFIFEKI